MTQQEFPGGWYADARPNGAFVVIFPDGRIKTDRGAVRPIIDNKDHLPLFPRLNRDGSKFAGQGWQTGQALEYDHVTGWRVVAESTHGVSPLIYDANDNLLLATPEHGSQGFRYVSPAGVVFTGDATYQPSATCPLFEWSHLGWFSVHVFVGQGPDGGLMVWDGHDRRVLRRGACRFIRAHRDGDAVSVACWVEGEGVFVWWGAVADLLALPVDVPVQPPAPTPVPPPVPVPPPAPVPVPPAPVPPPAPPSPAPPVPTTPVEVPVTVAQVATVFAGAFFEDVSKLLKLTGSEADRRERVHSWTRAKVRVINMAYEDIFRRPCDLEGFGSRLLLLVKHGWTDDQLKRALQDAYHRGDR